MEFIVSKDNADAELHRLQNILKQLPVFRNSEFRNVLLSAIAPFICGYYNIADVILTKVSQNLMYKKEKPNPVF